MGPGKGVPAGEVPPDPFLGGSGGLGASASSSFVEDPALILQFPTSTVKQMIINHNGVLRCMSYTMLSEPSYFNQTKWTEVPSKPTQWITDFRAINATDITLQRTAPSGTFRTLTRPPNLS